MSLSPGRYSWSGHRYLFSARASSKGNQGCPWAQSESMRGGQGQQGKEGNENRRDSGTWVCHQAWILWPACAKSSCLELAWPIKRLQPLTLALPSWPSSQTSQPHHGLSASLPVCWPMKKKGENQAVMGQVSRGDIPFYLRPSLKSRASRKINRQLPWGKTNLFEPLQMKQSPHL